MQISSLESYTEHSPYVSLYDAIGIDFEYYKVIMPILFCT